MAKRVTCIDCYRVDFVAGDNSDGWDFVGYDDNTELFRCPNCRLPNTACSGLATMCPRCGYMADFPICTKCGQAIPANR